ncbi:unnamed protein product [Caenorhabditis bovis]|uniref:Uncharacterized protein n=1 Tax=Caenorhabditis bovis TaxID=2654633 RepID=A0A8S1EEG5_9PELO|nr:unnamed protein product [Caenorhabditis bovis]
MELDLVETNPEILCTSALTVPPHSDGFKPIHLFNASAFVTVLFGIISSSIMGSSAVRAIQEMVDSSKVSKKTINMHRMFLFGLFTQIAVHGIMLGFPIFVYIVGLSFHIEANDLGYVAIILASTHGSMSTLSMIFCNKPIGDEIKFFLCKSFGKPPEKVVVSVAPTSIALE